MQQVQWSNKLIGKGQRNTQYKQDNVLIFL